MLTGCCGHHQHLILEYSQHPPKQPWAQELLLCAPHTPQPSVCSPGILSIVSALHGSACSGHLHKWRRNMRPFDLATCPHQNVFKVGPRCCRS